MTCPRFNPGKSRRFGDGEVRAGRDADRTGTALAALAILDGLTRNALIWVGGNYHRRAVERPRQRRWLRVTVGSSLSGDPGTA